MAKRLKSKNVISFNQIEFDKYLKRKVHRSNKTSGKITLPIGWIGKEVCVVLLEKNEL